MISLRLFRVLDQDEMGITHSPRRDRTHCRAEGLAVIEINRPGRLDFLGYF